MSLHQFKRLTQSIHGDQDESGPKLASIINEEFLNLPTAQQRARLQAATGDRGFQALREEELHKYIANAINQIDRQEPRSRGHDRRGDGHIDLQGATAICGRECVPAVSTVDAQGGLHHVLHDQLSEALDAGHTIVMPMTHPDGTHGYVPLAEMYEAQMRGFGTGHKSAGDGDGWLSQSLGWMGKEARSAANWANEKIEEGVDRWKGNRPAPPSVPAPKPLPIAFSRATYTEGPKLFTDMKNGTTTFYPGGNEKPITIETLSESVSNKPGNNDPFSTDDVTGIRHKGNTLPYGRDGAYIDVGDSRGRAIHGGGSILGPKHAYDPNQDLKPTLGCTRGHNDDVIDLGNTIMQYKKDHRGVKIPYERR